MTLGDAAEISLAVDDVAEASPFFEHLGFARAATIAVPYPTAAFSDGQLVLALHQTAFSSPTLTYYRSDLDALVPALREAGLRVRELRRTGGRPTAVTLRGPGGLRLVLSTREPAQQNGSAPPSRLGRFSELALPVDDRDAAADFWTRFGFHPVTQQAGPYPWGRYSDGVLPVGLHATEDFDRPAPMFFAEDTAERIAELVQAGLPFARRTETHAALQAPGGLLLFLFPETAPTPKQV